MTYFDLISNPQYPKKALIFKLIEFYTGKTKDQIHLEYNDPMDGDVEHKVIDGYRRYVDGGEPLEYITDNVSFLGNHFHIDGRALIPRPETEYMIQSVVEWIKLNPKQTTRGYNLFDVGTGCGVLGISTMIFAGSSLNRVYLTDIGDDILELASKNYGRHDDNLDNHIGSVHFIKSSMLDFVNQDIIESNNRGDGLLIVANLPYIPETTFDQNVDESAKKWEPREAFVGGDDCLDWYRVMFGQLFDLQSGGLTTPVTMFLEMMTWQMEILDREFGERIQFSVTKTFHFNIIIVQGKLSS